MAHDFPVLIGEALESWTRERFPFLAWAASTGFEYRDEHSDELRKCESAPEVFYLRAALENPSEHVTITPQKAVARFRVDFVVAKKNRRLAVEIDGKGFHRQTEDDVEAEHLRGRRLTAAGYAVVRFSAREIFRDAAVCWAQTVAILNGAEPR